MNALPSRVHDSQNELNYTLVGNYCLPDLEIESGQPIGKFGRARMKVLKEYRCTTDCSSAESCMTI